MTKPSGRVNLKHCEDPPASLMARRFVACVVSDDSSAYFDLPTIFILIAFLWVRSSLVIEIESLVDPFLVGE